MPDQSHATVMVTGPTSGIGTVTAREFARRGARVILAGRNPDKLATTARQLADQTPGARLEQVVVDVADLESVRTAAAQLRGIGPLTHLINNAGIMMSRYRRSDDGLEMTMATNHYGPFLLTGLLLPQLRSGGSTERPARVVTVASVLHSAARRAPLQDARKRRRPFVAMNAYSQSKLANLLFTYELDRRLRVADDPVLAMAAHPGFAATRLGSNGRYLGRAGVRASIVDAATRATAQPAEAGALPTLMAATADLPGSSYCGPSGLGELKGLPQLVGSSRLAHDVDAQRAMWNLSEEVTGFHYS